MIIREIIFGRLLWNRGVYFMKCDVKQGNLIFIEIQQIDLFFFKIVYSDFVMMYE